MNIHSGNSIRALSGLLMLAAVSTCEAGSIQLTPVRINLAEAAKNAVLTVKNNGTEEAVMQVTLNKWTLDGQHYNYEQSQELVITPVTFRLPAGGQQIVRIGLRDALPATKELAYRLLVEEVPAPITSKVTQARLVVRQDLPIFVAPLAPAKAAVDIALECAKDGNRLALSNIGNVHVQVHSIKLTANAAKKVLGKWDTFDYALPDAKVTWNLAVVAPATAKKNFHVAVQTDQGAFSADVKNTCR
jgi:fimbrial chaperone protein